MLDLTPQELDEIRVYLSDRVPSRALRRLDQEGTRVVTEALRLAVQNRQVLKRLGGVVPSAAALDEIIQQSVGLGRLSTLVNDPSVTSILALGGGRVECEVGGTWSMLDIPGWTDADLHRISQAITLRSGGHLDPGQPYFDTVITAADGAPIRVNISAMADDGEVPFTIALRRVKRKDQIFTLSDLVRLGSMSERMAKFLKYLAGAPAGILIVGAVGTGKSTTLQALELEMPDVPIAVVDDRTEYVPVHEFSFIQRTPPPPPMTSMDRPHADLALILWLTLRQHARVLIVTEVRGPETAVMLRESHARWASFCTFHGDSPEAAARRMVALARTDSWWMTSPYRGARDVDVYQDIVQSFPVFVLNDVIRSPDGKKARYVVRGIYHARMGPGDEEPEFVPLFEFVDEEWRESGEIPRFPRRVTTQRLQPTSVLALRGLEFHKSGKRRAARDLLEQAVRQTSRPDPVWLDALRDMSTRDPDEMRERAQRLLIRISGAEEGTPSIDEIRAQDPTLFAFMEMAQIGQKGLRV